MASFALVLILRYLIVGYYAYIWLPITRSFCKVDEFARSQKLLENIDSLDLATCLLFLPEDKARSYRLSLST